MKTIVAGSRDLVDYSLVEFAMKNVPWVVTEIVEGEAPGIDSLAKEYGNNNKIPVKPFPAEWYIYDESGNRKFIRYAGYVRNVQMANHGEGLILIWDLKSKGSKHMFDIAKKKKMPIFLVIVNYIVVGDFHFRLLMHGIFKEGENIESW